MKEKNVLRSTLLVFLLSVGLASACLKTAKPSTGETGRNSASGSIVVTSDPFSEQLVEGQKIEVRFQVKNTSDDIILMDSIRTDRKADETADFIESEYGAVTRNAKGEIIYDRLAQRSSPAVFFKASAVIFPGKQARCSAATRLFGEERKIILSYYRIPRAMLAEVVFAEQNRIESSDIVYKPVDRFEDIVETRGYVFWKTESLSAATEKLTVKPALTPAPFSLQKAASLLAQNFKYREISFCDTFGAWGFFSDNETWLVRSAGPEGLAEIDPVVFEKIDEQRGRNVRFRIPPQVPESEFASRFSVQEGDGMYTVGRFVTVAGEEILDVLRVFNSYMIGCRVYYYFFSSWYLDAITASDRGKMSE